MDRKGVNLTIFGRVQGVGFRFYTQRKARELDVSGFVKNQTDGTVYIEAEGIEENLDRFILWCYEGPTWAHVSNVNRQDVPVCGFDGFSIK